MKKELIIGGAVLVVIVVGIVFYAAVKPTPVSAPVVLTLPEGGDTEHAPYYDIAANYPTSTPLAETAGAAADRAAIAKIQSLVSGIISDFKTQGNFDHLSLRDISMMGFDKGSKESLQITYLIASSPRTVSYIFTTYEDTLGAHPNTSFSTLTFDTSTGQALALSDIFLSGSDYLGTLSTLARQMLPAIIGDSADPTFINPGTTPEAANFQNFFFDNKDFIILFAPYQVAPYSSGPQTLRIPVSQIRTILQPQYQQ